MKKQAGKHREFCIHFCRILGDFDCVQNKSMLEWGCKGKKFYYNAQDVRWGGDGRIAL